MPRTNHLIGVGALASLLSIAGPAMADRIPDGFNDAVRDSSRWVEAESTSALGCKAREFAGKLRFESRGVSSGASYRSRFNADWNDGFVVDWTAYASISRPSLASRSGRVGLALGWGAINSTAGFPDGINVEIVRSKDFRRLVLSVRQGGVVVDSASVSINAFEHDFRLVCTGGSEVGIEVFVDGSDIPALAIDGLETTFGTKHSRGMLVALLGANSPAVTMDCRVDNFEFWADQYDDSDDSVPGDSDSADDDDDKDGYDDNGDDEDGDYDDDGDDEGDDSSGDDDDGDGSDDSDGQGDALAAGAFADAVDDAVAASALPVLKAEAEGGTGTTFVEVLQWNAATSRLVEVKVNASTGAIIETSTRVPGASELSKWQPEIDALATVTVSLEDAVDSAVASSPGALVREVELELSGATLSWKVEILTPTGLRRDVRIAAR